MTDTHPTARDDLEVRLIRDAGLSPHWAKRQIDAYAKQQRFAVINECADELDEFNDLYDPNCHCGECKGCIWREAAMLLRRMAEEKQLFADDAEPASAVVPAADRAAPELTAEEARGLAEDLGYQLYRAQDALAFVGECCDIADRERRPVTTADVREWLKGARCGRQLVAEAADRAALRNRIAEALLQWAEGNNNPQYASMRRTETVRANAYSRADAVLSVLPAAVDRVAAETPQPEGEPTESIIYEYEVVGDWGVDSADSAEGARAAVAKWLREYPKCGAYAQQRVVREWSDGSEFYGPWTDLPDAPAVPAQPGNDTKTP